MKKSLLAGIALTLAFMFTGCATLDGVNVRNLQLDKGNSASKTAEQRDFQSRVNNTQYQRNMNEDLDDLLLTNRSTRLTRFPLPN